jgi:serine/threonine protein kinase
MAGITVATSPRPSSSSSKTSAGASTGSTIHKTKDKGATTSTTTTTTTSASSTLPTTTPLLDNAALQYARKAIHQLFDNSHIEDRTLDFPVFTTAEVVLGKVLGKGGFGTVSEVIQFKLLSSTKVVDAAAAAATTNTTASSSLTPNKSATGVTPQSPTLSSSLRKSTVSLRNLFAIGNGADALLSQSSKSRLLDEMAQYGYEEDSSVLAMESRQFIAQHCLRLGSGDPRYAMKILSPEIYKDRNLFAQGMIDMVVETRYLSVLEHPNIIKLRAVGTNEESGSIGKHSDPLLTPGYFIIIDRLYDTLEQRIKGAWKQRSRRASSFANKVLLDRKGTKCNELLEERLVAAFDLASAIEHLHERNILYRDLKPENIGFDIVRASFILHLLSFFYFFLFLLLIVSPCLLLFHFLSSPPSLNAAR